MDKIFHSTFDFFSHALPGFCMAFALFILDRNSNTPQDFLDHIGGLSAESIIALMALGYILGFAFFPLGRYLYKRLGKTTLKTSIDKNDVDLFLADKYVLVRELSPSNFKYVEIWNMYCAMAHNLAIACLIAAFFTGIKLLLLSPPNPIFWRILFFVNVLLFGLFLHRAIVFASWAANDLNATVRSLQLEKQAKNLPENKKG